MRTRRPTLLLVLTGAFPIVAIGGCGGGDGSFQEPHDVGPYVHLRPTSGYNGDRAELDNRIAVTSGATVGSVTTSTATYDGRRLTFTLPTAVSTGSQRFTPGVSGAEVLYTETNGRRWRAVGGTLRLINVGSTTYGVEIEGIPFTPDTTGTATAARGVFRLSGVISGLGYGVYEGPGSTTFSVTDGTSNVIRSPEITGNGASTYDGTGTIRLSITAPIPGGTRQLALVLPDAAAGVSGTLAQSGALNSLYYTESNADRTRFKGWVASAGDFKIISRDSTHVAVSLTHVTMAPVAPLPTNGATGTFVIDGVVRR